MTNSNGIYTKYLSTIVWNFGIAHHLPFPFQLWDTVPLSWRKLLIHTSIWASMEKGMSGLMAFFLEDIGRKDHSKGCTALDLGSKLEINPTTSKFLNFWMDSTMKLQGIRLLLTSEWSDWEKMGIYNLNIILFSSLLFWIQRVLTIISFFIPRTESSTSISPRSSRWNFFSIYQKLHFHAWDLRHLLPTFYFFIRSLQ